MATFFGSPHLFGRLKNDQEEVRQDLGV